MDWIQQWQSKLNKQNEVAPLVRTGGSRHTGLAALPHRNIQLNRQRSVFPSDTALLKALYLATFEATKKWTTTIRDWAQVYGELSIMYEGRLPE